MSELDLSNPSSVEFNSYTTQFNNQSDSIFTGIDSEEYRTYTFIKDGVTVEVTIEAPQQLAVSSSGGHRIFDGAGISHYIPVGWIALSWKAKAGQPNFVK